ncbi:MAG: hypothetical protein KF788_17590 [Piscinibacter sp.]|nr:hypothetical protein [Piscinibacter sp.]
MFHRLAATARRCSGALLVSVLASTALPALAQTPSRNLAPGFTHLERSDKIVLMPVDVELFSLSAGGVPEPKADWTADALGHMKTALSNKTAALGVAFDAVDDATADEFAEQSALQAAVARSIALHHGVGGGWALPTKQGKLDWSLGDTMKPIAQRTGARYGLFVWVRDSYASAERKAAMVALALLGIGIAGGTQVGYASLVDFETGRVLWFNRLLRADGDLRDATAAAETINVLMTGFPAVR